jgi:gamma-glutamylcyclotransferase (GGCT)/AIG2-like uncharacterized protein YtfP
MTPRAARGVASTTLWVYGSLLHAGLRRALLGRPVPAVAASLSGYRRFALRGQVFPALVSAAIRGRDVGPVQGALISVRPRDLRLLDAYESDLYIRTRVRVRSGAGGGTVQAWCYLLHPRHRRDADTRAWSLPQFERRHAARSIIEARAFRAAQSRFGPR